jgi:WhiB family redox-sensing transcriptional regulator
MQPVELPVQCPLWVSFQPMALVDLYAGLMQPGEPPNPLLDLVRLPVWHQEAACAGFPADWWFPPPGAAGCLERQRGADAVAVCDLCPVQEECLAFALREGVEGIWGGTSTSEREAMRQAA